MKRFLIFFICLITSCALVFLWWNNSRPRLQPVDLLADDTVAMLDFVEPEKTVRSFQASRLGRKLAGIQWLEVMRALEIPAEQTVVFRKKYEEIKSLVENPLFWEIFGRRVTVALVSGNGRQDAYDARRDILQDLVLIASPKHNASLLEELFSRFAGGDVRFTTASHRGVTIKIFALEPGLSICAATTGDLLVASFSPRLVAQCIDRALDAPPSGGLAHYEPYRSARARAGGGEDLFGYVDAPRLQPLIELFDRTAGNEPEGVFFRSLFDTGLETLVFFREPAMDLQQYTMIGKLAPDRSGSLRRFFSEAGPVANSGLERIPADVVAYYWTNWIALENYWKSMLSSPDPREREAAEKMEYKLRSKTGLTVEQLLGLFGNEITLAVNDFTTTGFFPMLRVAGCIAVEDPEGVENLMEKIVGGLPVQRTVVNDVPVVTVMAVNGLMQPSYAVLDNCLILADSREQIDSFLRAEQNPLLNDPDFQKVNMTSAEPNNMMLFARLNRIYAGLRELSIWIASINALRDKRKGERDRVIIEELILPLLDGLEMYRVKGARGVSGENEFTLQTAVIVEPEQLASSAP